MAIRDVVTRGFGNGVYNPGVTKLPTRGYSITVEGSAKALTVESLQIAIRKRYQVIGY